MRELRKDEIVAGFIVKDRIGSGGMGDVYLVHDEKLAVDRALKLVALTGPGFTGSKAEAAEYQERFMREARTLARLRHPNIIPVHATGEVDGSSFLVMSYFPSSDARHWLNKEQPELVRVRHVALQAARALAHAHQQGVLHRDIKLGNVLVGKDDEVMLIDFGLAKSAADADLTRTGRSMGTFSYLAPEYVKASTIGKPQHTVATDLWAFGCLLYALTCREPAFREKNEIMLLRLIARAQFAPVKARAPEVPDAWATLIHQLMEPDPARRLPSAAELVARLESIALRAHVEKLPAAEDSIAVAPPGPLPPPTPADDVDVAVPAQVDVPRDDGAADAGANNDADESILDHSDDTGATAEASALLPQPSFQLPPERASSARSSARKKLLLPIAAALVVLAVGAGLILTVGGLGARPARSTAYVDPEELQRKERAATELKGLADERVRRTSLHAVDMAPMPAMTVSTPDAEPRAEAVPRDLGNKTAAHRPRAAVAPITQSPKELDPWLARYGTRTSYNTSSGPPAATVVAPSSPTLAGAAGTRIAVRVTSAIASAPIGPVIAVVQSSTRLGNVEIPRGAELHGRVSGAEGPRVLVDFSFALVNGRTITLKGTALGSDGRAGVPAAKNVGGISDIAAGAAAGGAQALLDGAVGLVGNEVAAGAIRGATGPIVNKTGRLNNEEDLVVTERGSKFFVYVESVL